ncbi:hypothetical protein SO802_006870 [Lithocarpus litseifolius]|uniref:Uncharacterized protein n=1 Tax=Lithocarpus litseifolius TaxID=425828 RepID=A0AAW2DPN6_9ROSI
MKCRASSIQIIQQITMWTCLDNVCATIFLTGFFLTDAAPPEQLPDSDKNTQREADIEAGNLLLGILVLSGIVLLPVLLPIAATVDSLKSTRATESNGTFRDLSKLYMGHVKAKSPHLWAILIATYLISFFRYYLLWKVYKQVPGLRADALMSPEVKPEQFAVLVTDIPPFPVGQTRKAQDTRRDKQQDSALVFFTSRVIAASAAQRLHAQNVNKRTVTNAPDPRQLIWTNLKIKRYQRKVRQYVIYVIVALTIIFFMTPFGFISDLTTLEYLKIYLPFSKSIVNVDAIQTVLEAFLPQLALMIFLALLLKFLLFLSKAEGILSESHVVRAASGRYFYFSV